AFLSFFVTDSPPTAISTFPYTTLFRSATFHFGRHTGVTNEARAIVADWNAGEQCLTVYQGTQAPHMMQNLFAKHLGLQESQVRRSEEHTSELQSPCNLVCRLLLEKKNK